MTQGSALIGNSMTKAGLSYSKPVHQRRTTMGGRRKQGLIYARNQQRQGKKSGKGKRSELGENLASAATAE
jgi:hypothetical protein